MLYSPLLPVHITGGVVGILSGAAALAFRKCSPRACPGRKGLCRIHADYGCSRRVLGDPEAPDAKYSGVLPDPLSDRNGMADRPARRRRNEPLRLGSTSNSLAGGSWAWFIGLEKVFSRTPPKDGVPIGMDFFVGSWCSLPQGTSA
jgi:hypothetical protein